MKCKFKIIITLQYENTKKSDTPLLGQIINLIPKHIFADAISHFNTDKGCSTYMTYNHFVAVTFGQLNKCLSLTEINLGLGVDAMLLQDLDLKQSPAKSTMSDGNSKRNWRVFEYIYFELIKYYKGVFSKQEIVEIEGKSIKLVDATIITVCLNLFDWAKYRTVKGGIKIHTSLDEKIILTGKATLDAGIDTIVFRRVVVTVEVEKKRLLNQLL